MKRILRTFIPITRIDEEKRIVEGYAAVNEQVKSDKYKLTRSALQSATPDYASWGAVREMHQPSAVGTCNDGGQTEGLGVEWDDKGAFLRCKVVDDQAWEKVKQGVYKGFSVGIRVEKIERGNEVTECVWVETSLVDRPADPDAKIMAFRCEDDGDDEPTTERIEAHLASMVERGCFADMVKNCEKSKLRYASMVWFEQCLIFDGQYAEDPETHLHECVSEFEIYWLSRKLHLYGDDAERRETADLFRTLTSETVPSRENLEGKKKKKQMCDDDEEEEKKRIERLQSLEAENKTLLERAEAAESDLNKERESRRALQVQFDEMAAEPRATRPVKFTGHAQAVERLIGERSDESKKLQDELNGIIKRAELGQINPNDQDEQVRRVSEIKRILSIEYGIEVA